MGRRRIPLLACLAALSCGTAEDPAPPLPSPSIDSATGALLLHSSMGVSVNGEECLAALGNEVFFRAESAGAGSELWRTDGTAAGTRLAVDIVPGPEGSRPGCASVVGGRLFFPALTAGGRRDFWTSDGTAAGTVALDVWRTAFGTWTDSLLSDRALVGGRLFFVSDDGDHGAELFVTDGSRAGTSLVADIDPGPAGSTPFQLCAVGSQVFFSADDGVHGRELWTSDGTADGTRLVSDVFPGGEDSELSIRGVTDELVFFTARWQRVGSEYSAALFCAGPRRGIVRVLDVGGGTSTGRALGGRFLFLREDGASDGVWAADGTPDGTVRVASLRVFMDPVVAAGRLFFAGSDAEHGYELWASDGTPQGTRLVRDILPGTASSFPFSLTSLGDLVAFEARDGAYTTPWLSDGTSEGTRAAAALGRSASPRAFTRVGGRIYFVDSGQLFVLTGSFD